MYNQIRARTPSVRPTVFFCDLQQLALKKRGEFVNRCKPTVCHVSAKGVKCKQTFWVTTCVYALSIPPQKLTAWLTELLAIKKRKIFFILTDISRRQTDRYIRLFTLKNASFCKHKQIESDRCRQYFLHTCFCSTFRWCDFLKELFLS